MTLYNRDAAERLLTIATKATNIVETDSAHLAELAQTIIALYDRPSAPEPRIIRTVEELQDLDPDTLMIDRDGEESFAYRMQASIRNLGTESMYHDSFPAVIIATGDQTRAARQALEVTE